MSKYGETHTVLREEKYLVEALKEMGYEVEVHPEGAPPELVLLGPRGKGREHYHPARATARRLR